MQLCSPNGADCASEPAQFDALALVATRDGEKLRGIGLKTNATVFPLIVCLGIWLGFDASPVAAKDSGLDVLISADAIPSPEGFRPKPGEPIHYLFFQNRQTLGDAVAGVKLPEPAVVEKAVVAELEKQGFVRAAEGGSAPAIAIIATLGDANFEEPPIPAGNPYEDGEFLSYLELVNLRQVLQANFLWEKVPHTLQLLFIGDPSQPYPAYPKPYPPSNPDERAAQALMVDEAIRYRERGSGRAQDRGKIKALVGAEKVERAVSQRTLGGLAAERIARSVWDNQLYITLTAFDAKRQPDGGRRLLWRTTMLIDWREDFTKSLPAMLGQAGPMFGTDVAVPGYVNTAKPREGKVEIGESKVLKDGVAEPAGKK